MLRGMSLKQLDEWRVFEQLEPFPVERADWHIASIVATLSNIYRGKGKSPKPTADFLLHFGDDRGPEKPKQTWQEQKRIMAEYLTMMDRADAAKERKRLAAEQRKEARANVRTERRSRQRPT